MQGRGNPIGLYGSRTIKKETMIGWGLLGQSIRGKKNPFCKLPTSGPVMCEGKYTRCQKKEGAIYKKTKLR